MLEESIKEEEDYIDFNQLQNYIGISSREDLLNYLREIYKDLIYQNNKEQKPHITKISFIEYINLPIIISEKLFGSFDHDHDGYLNLREFTQNLLELYTGSFEAICSLIFDLLDFDHDYKIIPEDVKLLLSYLPLNTTKEYKFQMASLSEIDGIIQELFVDNKMINLSQFIIATEKRHSDAFLQILCFLYERKPFTNKSIDLLKKKKEKEIITFDSKIFPDLNNSNNKQLYSQPLPKVAIENKIHVNNNNAHRRVSVQEKKNLPTPNRKSIFFPASFLLSGMINYQSLSQLDDFILEHHPILHNNHNEESKDNSSLYQHNISHNHHRPSIDNLNHKFLYFEDWISKQSHSHKIKNYYLVLTGKDLFYYKDSTKEELKGMHHLSGCYIKSLTQEKIKGNNYYSFTLQFNRIKRTFITLSKQSATNWHRELCKAIGNLNFNDYYKVISELGEGKFGVVKLCQNKTTQMLVAVKNIEKKDMTESDIELLYNELEIMKIVHHPNIVTLVDLFENSEQIYIVMEYYKGGDLTHYLQKRKFEVSEYQMASIIRDIAEGIKYLHKYGIVHRDLKPDNIMLAINGNDSHLQAKIMDFGLSKIMGVHEKSSDGFGTLSFVSPEILLRKPYNKEIDIWSIGVIIYYGLTGQLPFDDENDDEEKIAKQTVYNEVTFPKEYWHNKSKDVIDLISHCFIKEASTRITIDSLLSHSWLRKYAYYSYQL